MTGEIQYKRLKNLFYLFPENQEYQRCFSVLCLILNITILLWKQETILIHQFNLNLPCPFQVLVCIGDYHCIKVFQDLIFQGATFTMVDIFIHIHLLHMAFIEFHLLTRMYNGQSTIISYLVSYTLLVSKEVQNYMMGCAHISSQMPALIISLLCLTNGTISHLLHSLTLSC